jgi:DNA polymerase-3 subunit alpha
MSKKWCPLVMRSSYSLLKAFANPASMASKCKDLGYTAAAITDNGSLSGCIEFFAACKKNNIKPILGCDFYVTKDVTDKTPSRELSHAVILAKNLNGWLSLTQCVSKSYEPGVFHDKPRIDLSIMSEFLGNDNICIIGQPRTDLADSLFTSLEAYDAESMEEVNTFLKPDWGSRALEVIADYKKIFGDNLFIGTQSINEDKSPVDKVITGCLRELCSKFNTLKPVAVANSHYVNKSDAELQRILICSNIGRKLAFAEKEIKDGKKIPFKNFFISDNYHTPSIDEISSIHTDKEIENSLIIEGMCEDYNILSEPQLPHFNCPNGMTEFDYLTHLCREGWKSLLIPTGKVNTPEKKSLYEARIKEELAVINDANLSGYFLIVYDIINYCKSKGWMTGVGRGSAAGCLISFLLGITGIDPVPHHLLFSRFFNSSRKGSLPDIDMDVSSAHRDEIIAYIKDKYGPENVSQMATFGCLMGKSALKEVFNICGNISFAEMNDITDLIPDKAAIEDELESLGETSLIRWALTYKAKKFEQWVKLEEDGSLTGDLAEYFAKAIALEGTPKSQGRHAGGVIISTVPLSRICPMVRDKDGNAIAGYDMHGMEALGQVKFDVLGLDFLDKIMDIATDKELNITDFNDKATWDLLASGDTKGVFQIERQGAWTKELKPNNLDHLSALMAIIRPGVSEAMLDGKTMTKHYIDRKNGLEEPTYMHPSLEPILKDTFGVIIYQESAMRIARELAGFSLNEADILRKAMGKKDAALMAKVKGGFIEGCKKQGVVDEATADAIFDWIEKAQRYLFNASHSYSYAVNAYYSAYCKTHNLVKFYEAYLNRAFKDQDKMNEINELVNDAKNHNVAILPPSLCNFHKNFKITGENQIHFGVAHIKDVGEKEVIKLFDIVESCDRDICYLSWLDILLLLGNSINKKAFMALASVGALNGENNKMSRTQMLYEFGIWRELTDREIKFISENLDSSKDLVYHINLLVNKFKITASRMKKLISCISMLKDQPYDVEDNIRWVAAIEKQHLGISMTCSMVDGLDASFADTTCRDILSGNVRDKSTVTVAAELRDFREHKIKKDGPNKGKSMAFLSIEDLSGQLKSVTMFPDQFNLYKDLLFDSNTLLLEGKIESRGGEKQLVVEKVFQI